MMTLDLQIGQGRDDVVYLEVLEGRQGMKLQVRIVSDSYAHQCSATVCLWSGTRWETLHSIHASLMKTRHNLRIADSKGPEAFKADRDHLLKIAGCF